MTDRKDIMAPGNEPTDDELSLVMREARDEAMRKRNAADAAWREHMRAAVASARELRDRLVAERAARSAAR